MCAGDAAPEALHTREIPLHWQDSPYPYTGRTLPTPKGYLSSAGHKKETKKPMPIS